ncbi:MAG: SDR family NAD(P)-dependent oxidoreductase [Myxococcales bacterium FL481]|nr:MAG: SDR family NAD(P)-dependent oxidoreductase [Myxococcales bacterium FL481]
MNPVSLDVSVRRVAYDGGMDLRDRVAIVTGAGSGLGAALAVTLSRLGARLVLVGRRRDRLEDVSARCRGRDTLICAADVGIAAEVNRVVASAIERFGQLDIVVNNAAVALGGTLTALTPREVEYLVRVDLVAPIWLCQSALPHLLDSAAGRVVNVGSLSGLLAMPSQSAYCGAKFGLRGFTEALRHDLVGTSVKVLAVYPGAMDTEMNTAESRDKAGIKGVAAKTVHPDDAAARIVRAMRDGRSEIIVAPLPSRLMPVVQRWFPAVFSRLAQRVRPEMDAFMLESNNWARERMASPPVGRASGGAEAEPHS